MNGNIRIIDHKENIQIDLNNPPVHNLHALDYLPSGLFTLAKTMREQEIGVLSYNVNTLGMTVENVSNSTSFLGVVGIDNNLCICLYHWFSVSLSNYLRLVGLIDFYAKYGVGQNEVMSNSMKKAVKEHCDKYASSVSPNVIEWRNKIGAHMAITSPYQKDSQGTLEMSAQNTLSYTKLRVFTGGFTWVANNEPANLPTWSLTEEFELLSSRLWPTFQLTDLNPN